MTQRAVAKRADSSLSAMTYYFADLQDMIDCAEARGLRDRIHLLVQQTDEPGMTGDNAASAITNVVVPAGDDGRTRMAMENLTTVGDLAHTQREIEHLLAHLDAALTAVWSEFDVAAPAMPRVMTAMVCGAIVSTPPGEDARARASALITEYLAVAARPQ